MLIDTHAHLDFVPEGETLEGWLERAQSDGMDKIISIGTSVEASKKCVEIAQKHSTSALKIFATVGIHAEDWGGDVKKYGSLNKCMDNLKEIASKSTAIVGVGECGFDFKVENDRSPEIVAMQKDLFEAQIKLSLELRLPLIVHCRNGWDETFKLLGKFSNIRGLFHSWTGDWEAAKKALALGFYISFSGIVTFKNAPNVSGVANRMPLDKMLLETDSPFLSPEPMRGQQNEPKNVKIVAQFIARLRNLPVPQVASITSENAGVLFRMSKNG